jgi:hypothetical protein
VIFLESVVVYCCVAMMTEGVTFRRFGTAALAAVLVLPFRFYAVYLAAFTILVTATLAQVDWRRYGAARASWTALAVAMVIAGLPSS